MPLRPIEVAYGLAIGRHEGIEALPAGSDRTPRQALEDVLLAALRRPPCVVSFSGGRDSSALLAAATSVARREGLRDPVPATLMFPGELADEAEWQRRVLDHIGIDDWVRLEFTDELGAIGPVAGEVMRRHGLVWPFNLHYHAPIMEVAAGGSVVTGFAGDELAVSCTLVTTERLVAECGVHGLRDAARVAYRWAPRPLRWPREILRAGEQIDELEVRWLTSRGRRELTRAFAADALLHRGWDTMIRDNFWRSRYFQVSRANFQIVADAYDVQMAHPFVEAPLLRALADHGGPTGLRGREAILELLVGDLLPADVINRQSKATFTESLWTADTLEFAGRWGGAGVPAAVVDEAALRRAWAGSPHPVLATTLLQSAWLAEEA